MSKASTYANAQSLADQLVAALRKRVEFENISGDDANAYLVGYLSSFVASLSASSPICMDILIDRIQTVKESTK